MRSDTTTREMRSEIETQFNGFFVSQGYNLTDEVPPHPSTDPTVQFIGAQISVWKPHLGKIATGELEKRITPQDCIRLQNKKAFYDTEQEIEYCSYFRTLGAIGRASLFGTMVMEAGEFLESISITPERLCIKTSRELSEYFSVDIETLEDTEQEKYYEWGYGEEDLSGQGVTFCIRDEQDGKPRDIGNVIIIKKNGQPYVSEWGFGIETLLTAKHSAKHPLYFADLPKGILEKITQSSLKYIDALMTCLHMAKLGVVIGERGPGSLLDEYLKGVAYQGVVIRKTIFNIEDDLDAISRHIFVPEVARNLVFDRLEFYTGRINYIKERARSDLTLHGYTSPYDITPEMIDPLIEAKD